MSLEVTVLYSKSWLYTGGPPVNGKRNSLPHHVRGIAAKLKD